MTSTLTPDQRRAAWRLADRADHPCCWCATDTGRVVPVRTGSGPTGCHICSGCAERLQVFTAPDCQHQEATTP